MCDLTVVEWTFAFGFYHLEMADFDVTLGIGWLFLVRAVIDSD